MRKFLRQIRQWFQRFFQGLFGGTVVEAAYGGPGAKVSKPLEPLSDTDYEFLFSQLLEGIGHGWHEGRVLKFFEQLGDRGKTKLWVSWLDRFGEKVLASPSPNLELAGRMMRLGELSQCFPKIDPIGQKAYHLARQLYARQAPSEPAIWEYGGPDVTPVTPAEELPPGFQQETFTLEELMEQLKTDEPLAQQLAADLGLTTTEPEQIIAALLTKFQITQENLASQPLPDNAGGWLARGLDQANIGHLEEAIASWDQAITLDPTLSQAWHNRGSALGNLGRLEEALDSFQQAVVAQEEDYQAWFNQGLVLEALGRNEDAINCYQKTLSLAPEFEPAIERLQGFNSPV
ncbi:MAG: tetratricopeptide repeat protein [Microcystaceae cyanobacterium]